MHNSQRYPRHLYLINILEDIVIFLGLKVLKIPTCFPAVEFTSLNQIIMVFRILTKILLNHYSCVTVGSAQILHFLIRFVYIFMVNDIGTRSQITKF